MEGEFPRLVARLTPEQASVLVCPKCGYHRQATGDECAGEPGYCPRCEKRLVWAYEEAPTCLNCGKLDHLAAEVDGCCSRACKLQWEYEQGRPKRVLVTGSREWQDPRAIERRLMALELPRGSSVMHGAARGADLLAGGVARSIGLEERAFPADWRGQGKRAGILRNLKMLDEAPDVVLAFQVRRSKGTGHTIEEAVKRGIRVVVTRHI